MENRPQDGDHGLPTIQFPWKHDIKGIHKADEGGGANISGLYETSGLVFGVRIGVGIGVPSVAPPNLEHRGSRGSGKFIHTPQGVPSLPGLLP